MEKLLLNYARPRHGLLFWLRLSYAALVILTAATLALLIDRQVTGTLEAEARARVAGHARLLADRFDDALQERLADIRQLAVLPTFKAPDPSPDVAHALFRELRLKEPDYAWIGFADASGRVVVGSNGMLEGADVSERPWFAAAQKQAFIGGAHDAALLAKLLPAPVGGLPLRFIDVAAPVRDAHGMLVGVICAHLALQWADHLQHKLLRQATQLGSAEVLVTDKSGLVLLGPSHARGRQLNPANSEEYLSAQASTRKGMGEGLDWTVIVRTPRSEAFDGMKRIRHTITSAAAGLALVAVLMAALLARHITAPLTRLAEAAVRMRTDRSVQLPSVGGYREASLLQESLGELLGDLTAREQELMALTTSLERRVAERTEALEKANAELASLAATDSLTGLANRRRFDETLAFECRRAIAKRLPLCLLLIDLDHFKQINDTHGHITGDRVLQAIAAVLAERIRPSDLVARVGGEEFAVLAPGLDDEQALELGERLRRAVSDANPYRAGRESIRATISVGVSTRRHLVAETTEALAAALYKQADQGLYRAKQAGRNRVGTLSEAGPSSSADSASSSG